MSSTTTQRVQVPSLAIAGIDFSKIGEGPLRQLGYGKVVHSDNVHDGSVIPMPIAVISSGPGPTALIVAGTHGDEYEGQVLAHEMIRQLKPESLSGTVIIVPAANTTAVRQGTRISPVDDGNLNRSYPGHQRGGPTDQVAAIIGGELVPRADFVIDMHSGGSNSTYLKCAFIYRGPNEDLWQQKVRASRLLGLPYVMVVAPLLEPGSLSSAGDLAEKLTISTELAGSGTVDRHALNIMRSGLPAVLADLGIMKSSESAEQQRADQKAADPQFVELVAESAVTSTGAGLFEPLVDLDDNVVAGQPVGRVHFIDELDREPKTLTAVIDGVVAILRRPTLVRVGTHVMHIARRIDPSTL